jgi:hypothetical protein
VVTALMGAGAPQVRPRRRRRGCREPGKDLYPGELEWSLMSKRTVKRKLRAKKKANHGKKPNCGRG